MNEMMVDIALDNIQFSNKELNKRLTQLFDSILLCNIPDKSKSKIFKIGVKEELEQFTLELMRVRTKCD